MWFILFEPISFRSSLLNFLLLFGNSDFFFLQKSRNEVEFRPSLLNVEASIRWWFRLPFDSGHFDGDSDAAAVLPHRRAARMQRRLSAQSRQVGHCRMKHHLRHRHHHHHRIYAPEPQPHRTMSNHLLPLPLPLPHLPFPAVFGSCFYTARVFSLLFSFPHPHFNFLFHFFSRRFAPSSNFLTFS